MEIKNSLFFVSTLTLLAASLTIGIVLSYPINANAYCEGGCPQPSPAPQPPETNNGPFPGDGGSEPAWHDDRYVT